jgi:phospholipase C
VLSACSNAVGVGPGAGSSPAPSATASATPSIVPPFDRVVVVVMENREFDQVVGNPHAPYVNGLAQRFSLATQSYGVSHPSLPNYLALLGGSTFDIATDCTTCSVPGRNLVDQLEAHRISWKAYMEGMPAPCYDGASRGRYAKKHDPFMYFDDVRGDAARCRHVVPFGRLHDDLASGTLPRFVWISPDLCHDGHDCPIATADRFLKRRLPPLLHQLGMDGVLVLTWDEGATDGGCCTFAVGGHIATIVAGPGARRGARSGVPLDHYSILRTIEESWGMQRLRHAACACTRPMTSLLR